MLSKPLVTRSPGETEIAGAQIGRRLQPSDIVALYGDLGAGKTHLVRGLCAGLGGQADEVSSPTFAIVQTYATDPPLHHIDAYRLDGPGAFRAVGGEELLWGDDVCAVEWPSRIESLLPPHTIRLLLTEHRDGSRTIAPLDAPPPNENAPEPD
jgi:tRNA threonylcarbamoyladenosine biosynthesis protein TsaE